MTKTEESLLAEIDTYLEYMRNFHKEPGHITLNNRQYQVWKSITEKMLEHGPQLASVYREDAYRGIPVRKL